MRKHVDIISQSGTTIYGLVKKQRMYHRAEVLLTINSEIITSN